MLYKKYLLKHVVEGRREETETGGRRRKQLTDNFKKYKVLESERGSTT
jgi:hypothetical protein